MTKKAATLLILCAMACTLPSFHPTSFLPQNPALSGTPISPDHGHFVCQIHNIVEGLKRYIGYSYIGYIDEPEGHADGARLRHDVNEANKNG